MITIRSLEKSFGSKHVLKQVNLDLAPGILHGLVGENGAGKTTLFRCIAGLETYDGTIAFSGGSIKDVTGFLPTTPFFLSRITGREYLQLLCNARKVKTGDLNEKNIFELPLDEYTDTYSTGMKKKLALTGVLLQGNDIFLLDEPFNGVDLHSNLIIQEILLKLRELGKTVVISSHIFSILSESCDVIHYLKQGAIGRSVGKEGFASLEQEMRGQEIQGMVERLGLR